MLRYLRIGIKSGGSVNLRYKSKLLGLQLLKKGSQWGPPPFRPLQPTFKRPYHNTPRTHQTDTDIDTPSLSEQTPQERITQLTQELKKHIEAYYVEANPTISDYQYDLLIQELEALEQAHPDLKLPDSPTEKVGHKVENGIAHLRPMLSLSNTYNREEVGEFFKRVQKSLPGEKVQVITELKFDGTALSVHYKNGIFKYALTRGDGVNGEDVTYAFKKYIKQFPKSLKMASPPEHLEVRGEVIIDEENFQKANANQEKKYATKRNLASGVMNRKKNSDKYPDMDLLFVPYGVEILSEDTEKLAFPTQSQKLEKLEALGFTVDKNAKVFDVEDTEGIFQYLDHWNNERPKITHDIDGIVIKVNSVQHQLAIGQTAKCPKWATAYKFPPTKFHSKLLDIALQVGRTGKVTPVAIFEPIDIDGIKVQRETLHNKQFIEEHKILTGKTVIIERSGDVIPKVLGVVQDEKIEEANLGSPIDWKVCPCPKKEPLCSKDDKVDVYCESPLCAQQIIAKLVHFASKKAVNIDGMGPSTVAVLVNFGVLNTFDDIFKLHTVKDALLDIPGWGQKKVSNLLESIEQRRKNATFTEVLYGIGIPHIGRETAGILAKQFQTLDNLRNASLETIMKIKSLGDVTAQSVYDFFHPKTRTSCHPNVISNLILYMDNLTPKKSFFEEAPTPAPKPSVSSIFKDKTVVVTGKIGKISRDEVQDYIQRMGAKIKTTVGSGIDYIVVGEKPNSKKMNLVMKHAIKSISAEQFIEEYEQNTKS